MLPTGLENYHVIDLVGEGSFGKVNKATHKRSGAAQCCLLVCTHDVRAMVVPQQACT
jgi:serine/threonine protein kinase